MVGWAEWGLDMSLGIKWTGDTPGGRIVVAAAPVRRSSMARVAG